MEWWPVGFDLLVFVLAILAISIIIYFHYKSVFFRKDKLSFVLLAVVLLILYGLVNYDRKSGMTVTDIDMLTKIAESCRMSSTYEDTIEKKLIMKLSTINSSQEMTSLIQEYIEGEQSQLNDIINRQSENHCMELIDELSFKRNEFWKNLDRNADPKIFGKINVLNIYLKTLIQKTSLANPST